MASFTLYPELRPCLVNDMKALFHRWVVLSETTSPSFLIGRHNKAIIDYVMALIEYEDGHVGLCYPNKIKFLDNKFRCCDFSDESKR